MGAPNSVKRSKSHLAITMLLIGVALMGGPHALAHFGLMPDPKPKGWIVLVVAYVGALLKASIGYLMTRDFRYDKTAYDLSALVFGGALTLLAVQILSDAIQFPGLRHISFFSFTSTMGLNEKGQHIVLLFLFLLGSLIATILSSMGVADTESEKPNGLWTLFCSFIAYVLVGTYALALIAKE